MKYFLLITGLVFAACDADQESSVDELLAQMEALQIEIDNLIEIGCAEVSACKSAAMGVKACGGPTHYVIYSSQTDETKLNELISAYDDLNEEYNIQTEAISDCSVGTPPTLGCVDGNCEVG